MRAHSQGNSLSVRREDDGDDGRVVRRREVRHDALEDAGVQARACGGAADALETPAHVWPPASGDGSGAIEEGEDGEQEEQGQHVVGLAERAQQAASMCAGIITEM